MARSGSPHSVVTPAQSRQRMYGPVELNLELTPRARVDVIGVHHRAGERAACLSAFPKALACSFHPTAGHLEPGLAARLPRCDGLTRPYLQRIATVCPP